MSDNMKTYNLLFGRQVYLSVLSLVNIIKEKRVKKRIVQIGVVCVMVLVCSSVSHATYVNTVKHFLDDWEHLSVGGYPGSDGWGKDYDPVIENGNIGGTGSKILNLDNEKYANIRREDIKVLPDANGDIIVEYDYKFDWSTNNYNFYIVYGQNGLSGGTAGGGALDPRVIYWLWVSSSYTDRRLRQWNGSSYDVLLRLNENTDYHFVDVIHTDTGLHDLTVTPEGGSPVIYSNLITDTSDADWSSTNSLNTMKFEVSSDSYSTTTWLDNISVSVPPPPQGTIIIIK